MNRWIAACCVLIGVASCTARYSLALEQPPMSPSQQAREQQLHEAARLQGEVKQDCAAKTISDHWVMCISAGQVERMRREKK